MLFLASLSLERPKPYPLKHGHSLNKWPIIYLDTIINNSNNIFIQLIVGSPSIYISINWATDRFNNANT